MMRNPISYTLIIIYLLLICSTAFSQQAKQVNYQTQLWASINSNIRISSKWGIVADAHVRRTNFAADPSFYFARVGASYRINEHFNAVAGYAHMWQANALKDQFVYGNENRVYEQLQFINKWNKFGYTLRFRNEHRWQQKLINGEKSGDTRYTNRVRFLAGFNYQVFKNPYLPKLMLADEVCIQFGKEVVYNTFDQNRFTIGIFQKINDHLSFDLGYMLVYQHKYSGYQYDHNNTLRLFFYYTPDLRKK
jgi:hypothetical protein